MASNQGKVLILNALFWGLLLIGAALVFKGSPHKDRVMTFVSLATVMSGMMIALKYRKKEKKSG